MRIAFWALTLAIGLLFVGAAKCAQQENQAGASVTPVTSQPASSQQPASGAAPTAGKPVKGLNGMSFVYLHHSCGSGFLDEGGMSAKLTALGLDVHDITYGDGWIGDNTNPDHFPTTFGEHMDEVLGWELSGGKKHDIVAFKSCFPACDVSSDEMLEAYKGYYNALKPLFAKQPKTLFVAWTAPPLVPGATKPENAARYRKFAQWLKTEWPKGQGNAAVFDCYNLLAGKDNMLRSGFRRNESDSHPNAEGNKAVAQAFADWLPGAVKAWQG
jgi:hypothetical protein